MALVHLDDDRISVAIALADTVDVRRRRLGHSYRSSLLLIGSPSPRCSASNSARSSSSIDLISDEMTWWASPANMSQPSVQPNDEWA